MTCFLRVAYTSPAAISRLGIVASSDPSPATTRFGACAERGKAAVHRHYQEWNSNRFVIKPMPPCFNEDACVTKRVSQQTTRLASQQLLSSPSKQANRSTLKHTNSHLSSQIHRYNTEREHSFIYLPHTQKFLLLPLQACVLHVCRESPEHPMPPFLGSGLVQVLVRVPPPHVFEHAPKAVKPPCTRTNKHETVSTFMSE